jgi:hypothetical protein
MELPYEIVYVEEANHHLQLVVIMDRAVFLTYDKVVVVVILFMLLIQVHGDMAVKPQLQ